MQWLLFEHRGESRTGVFGIDIDVAGDHRLLGQECAAEIELAADVSVQAVFEVLRDDLSEDELLAEVLGSTRTRGS